MCDHFVAGKPTLYKKDVHIPMLIESFMEGHDIYQFCAKAYISRKTLYNWMDKCADLRVTYEALLTLAQGWWEHKGATDKDVNPTVWSMIMKNRFNYANERRLAIPKIKGAKTFDEQYEAIVDHLSEGNITGQEANQLANLISAGVRIKQSEEVALLKAEMARLCTHLGVEHEFATVVEAPPKDSGSTRAKSRVSRVKVRRS